MPERGLARSQAWWSGTAQGATAGTRLLPRSVAPQVSCLKKEEKGVKCVICRGGQTRLGRTAVILEQENTTLVFKAVRAEMCANRGEAYAAQEVSRQILTAAELAARPGVRVDVREFVGAAT